MSRLHCSPPLGQLFAHRKVFCLSALWIALSSTVAFARLGETARECEKIYGKPVGATAVPGLIPNGLEYHRGEYSIICGFEDNECVVVVVLRLSPKNPTLTDIPRSDIGLFMEENFGSTSWVYTRLDSRGKFWKSYDWARQCSYRASYANSLQMLTLQMGDS